MSDPQAKKVAFETLGCKLNQYETDALAAQFLQNGYEIVDFQSRADAYIINTCTVTNKADRKSRNIIHRVLGEPEPVVVVTGCYAESAREELEKSGVTYLVDNKRKSQIFHLLDAHYKGEILPAAALSPNLFDFPVSESPFHTRSTVKIQDGCDNFCSFCIIPFVRGRAQSRPAAGILDHVRELVDKGAREIVFTGVNMSRYRDGATDFTKLLASVLELQGDFRVRLSSLEPELLEEAFLELLSHPKMCPHLHLCLQSASERVLLQMRREYRFEEYEALATAIRGRIPDFNLTTDVIVGFPGETDEDHALTREAIRRLEFGHVHVFKFSKRQGTRAERMDGQLPEIVKTRRSEDLHRLALEAKASYRRTLIGRTERVLVEKADPSGMVSGLGQHYVPVEFHKPGAGRNTFHDVRITGLAPGDDAPLLGIPV